VTKTANGFVAALGVGLLAGVLYHLMGVPTPAPPWWALCGLLGIVVGETGGGIARDRWGRRGRRAPPRPAAEEGSNP